MNVPLLNDAVTRITEGAPMTPEALGTGETAVESAIAILFALYWIFIIQWTWKIAKKHGWFR